MTINIKAINNQHIQNSSSTKKNQELDRDAFLNLLITQLRNQDPLNPVEDKEFIAQMAQFSSLEQIQNLNKTMMESQKQVVEKLAQLNQLSSSSISFQAFNLIGKEITAVLGEDGDNQTIKGVVTSIKVAGGIPVAYIGEKAIQMANIAEIRNVTNPTEERDIYSV